jgi:hypothetical protein
MAQMMLSTNANEVTHIALSRLEIFNVFGQCLDRDRRSRLADYLEFEDCTWAMRTGHLSLRLQITNES